MLLPFWQALWPWGAHFSYLSLRITFVCEEVRLMLKFFQLQNALTPIICHYFSVIQIVAVSLPLSAYFRLLPVFMPFFPSSFLLFSLLSFFPLVFSFSLRKEFRARTTVTQMPVVPTAVYEWEQTEWGRVGNGEITETTHWNQTPRFCLGRNQDLGNGYNSCIEIWHCFLDSIFLKI